MSNSFDTSGGSNRKWWVIGGGCLLVFACLCIAAIIAVLTLSESTIAQLRQLAGLSTESASIEFVPANAPIYAAVNPNFSQLASFAKLKAVFDRHPIYAQKLEQLAKESAARDSDFNFERDLRPWLGADVGFAVLEVPPTTGAGATTPPKFVMIAATRDKTKSDEALARIRKAAEAKGTTFSEEKHKDVTIVVGKTKSGNPRLPEEVTAYATYQGQVLFANSVDAIKTAIDTKQGGEKASLKSNPNYNAVVAKLPKERAMTMVLDARAVLKSATTNQPRTPGMENLDAFSSMGMALGFTDDGIRIDAVVAYDMNAMSGATKNMFGAITPNANKVYDGLPSSSLIAFSGQNLKLIWDYYFEALGQDPQSKRQLDQGLRDFKTQTGIDINEDLISWMTGEYAISAVPAKPLRAIGPDAPGIGLLLMFEAKEPGQVKGKLDKIAQALGKQGLVFAAKKVSGADMQVVKGLEQQGISLGYGFVDNFLVIGSAEDVLGLAVDAKKAPLSKDAEFLLDAKVLPKPGTGVGYISIPALVEILRPTMSRPVQADFDKETAPLLKQFKSIAVGSSTPQDGIQTSVIFIHVAE